MNIFKFV